MGCDNRCNSSLTCGITNTIIKKLIAENCGEGGIDGTGNSLGDAPIIIKSCNTLNLGSIPVGPVGE